MGRKLLALLFICMFTAGGCASVVMQSTQMKPSVSKNTITHFQSQSLEYGIHYFLPTGKIKLKLSETNLGRKILEYVETVYEPDLDYFFLLQYKPVSTSEDDVTINITNDGLLDKITVTTKEQTVAIVEKIIEIAKEAAKLALGVPVPGGFKAAGTAEKVVKEAVFVVDLLDSEELSKLNNKFLSPSGFTVALERYKNWGKIITKDKDQDTILGGNHSIYYRPLLPYKLIIRSGSNEAMQTVLLPNEAPVLGIDITRTAFIEKITELDFEKGTLKSIHIKKPSEALAFADIPLSIIRGILSLPSELITVKVNNSNLNNQLMNAYKTELETKEELEKLRMELGKK